MATFATNIATPPHHFASIDAADHSSIPSSSTSFSTSTSRRQTRASFAAELSGCLVDFVVQLLPTAEEMTVKEDVRKLLERLIRNIEPGSRLLSFGSTANGFSLRNSDMDLCCLIDSDQPPLSASDMVTMLGDLLERETKFHVKPLPHARIPIIKLSLPASQGLPFGISCDIGFENRLALENTRLLFSYASVDPTRIRTMVLFLKVWSKRRKINSPYRGTLSSYGYVLLVLYFLIHVKNPPVLPNLQTMPPLREMRYEDTHLNGCNIWFFDDIELLKQRWCSLNTESVAELLMDFFKFYARDFTYNLGVASIRAGLLKKESKGWLNDHDAYDARDRNRLCIEDPFETTYNVARTVTKEGLFLIRGEFMRASRILAARPTRAIVALAQLCEERDESIPVAPTGSTLAAPVSATGTQFYATTSPAQTPYAPSSPNFATASTHNPTMRRPSAAIPITPVVDRLMPQKESTVELSPKSSSSPSQAIQPTPIHASENTQQALHEATASAPAHMAPTRARWTSPPPPEASPTERHTYEQGLGLGLRLATLSGEAREAENRARSWSESSLSESAITDDDSLSRSDQSQGSPSVVSGSSPPGPSIASFGEANAETDQKYATHSNSLSLTQTVDAHPVSPLAPPPPYAGHSPLSSCSGSLPSSSSPATPATTKSVKPTNEVISFPGKPNKSYAPPTPVSTVLQYGRTQPTIVIPEGLGLTEMRLNSTNNNRSVDVALPSGGANENVASTSTNSVQASPVQYSPSTSQPPMPQVKTHQPSLSETQGPGQQQHYRPRGTPKRPPATNVGYSPPRFSTDPVTATAYHQHQQTPPRFSADLSQAQWYYLAAAYGQDLQLLQQQYRYQQGMAPFGQVQSPTTPRSMHANSPAMGNQALPKRMRSESQPHRKGGRGGGGSRGGRGGRSAHTASGSGSGSSAAPSPSHSPSPLGHSMDLPPPPSYSYQQQTGFGTSHWYAPTSAPPQQPQQQRYLGSPMSSKPRKQSRSSVPSPVSTPASPVTPRQTRKFNTAPSESIPKPAQTGKHANLQNESRCTVKDDDANEKTASVEVVPINLPMKPPAAHIPTVPTNPSRTPPMSVLPHMTAESLPEPNHRPSTTGFQPSLGEPLHPLSSSLSSASDERPLDRPRRGLTVSTGDVIVVPAGLIEAS